MLDVNRGTINGSISCWAFALPYKSIFKTAFIYFCLKLDILKHILALPVHTFKSQLYIKKALWQSCGNGNQIALRKQFYFLVEENILFLHLELISYLVQIFFYLHYLGKTRRVINRRSFAKDSCFLNFCSLIMIFYLLNS